MGEKEEGKEYYPENARIPEKEGIGVGCRYEETGENPCKILMKIDKKREATEVRFTFKLLR